jgi:hypothetical protein
MEEELGEVGEKNNKSTNRGHGKALDEGHVVEAGHAISEAFKVLQWIHHIG